MPTVSNTSPLSNLACIGRLKVLQQQFHEVWIPDAVDKELRNIPSPRKEDETDQTDPT